jgi:hypothetical protein
MNDHEEDQREQDREQPKYVADEAGRSWLEALQHARTRTARQREVRAQMREVWGLREDASSDG